MKNHYEDDSKAKMPTSTQKVTTEYTNDAEGSENVQKEKKMSRWNHRRNQEDSTSATGVNKVEVGDYRKKKKDVSEITYYNCNKWRYYWDKCLEPQKLKN